MAPGLERLAEVARDRRDEHHQSESPGSFDHLDPLAEVTHGRHVEEQVEEIEVEENRRDQPPDLSGRDRGKDGPIIPESLVVLVGREREDAENGRREHVQHKDDNAGDDQPEGERGPMVHRPFPPFAEVLDPLAVVFLNLLLLLADLLGRLRRRLETGVGRVRLEVRQHGAASGTRSSRWTQTAQPVGLGSSLVVMLSVRR